MQKTQCVYKKNLHARNVRIEHQVAPNALVITTTHAACPVECLAVIFLVSVSWYFLSHKHKKPSDDVTTAVDNDDEEGDKTVQTGKKTKAKRKKKPKDKKAPQALGGRNQVAIAPAKPPLLIFSTNAHTSVRPRMDVEKELPP